jgi:hypothetical protein
MIFTFLFLILFVVAMYASLAAHWYANYLQETFYNARLERKRRSNDLKYAKGLLRGTK